MFLGIDLGTTNFKFGLLNPHSGELSGLVRIPVTVEKSGKKVEMAPSNFWDLIYKGITESCKDAGVVSKDISGISFSSQANSFIILDQQNKPLCPIIIWTDERANSKTEKIEQLWKNPSYEEISGTSFQTPRMFIYKLSWMLENVDELSRKNNIRVLNISDYLTLALTGEYVADGGTASLTGIIDLDNLSWWDHALDILSFDPEWFPELILPGTVVGRTNTTKALELGLNSRCSFIMGSLDHHMAAIGSGVGGISSFSESTGTVLAAIELSDNRKCVRGGTIGPHINKGEYFRLAFNSNGGAVLEWYKKNYAPNYSFKELNRLAERVSPGAEGMLAEPYADKYGDLSGFNEGFKDIKNVSDEKKQGMIVRSIMESSGVSLLVLLKELVSDKPLPDRIMATGGGAESEIWRRIKASITGAKILTTYLDEPACIGACLNAASGELGIKLEHLIKDWIQVKETVEQDASDRKFYLDWIKNLDLKKYR